MSEEFVLGGRYIARATPQNTQNDIQGGAEVRLAHVDVANVSFEVVGKNGTLPRRSLMVTRALFGANFTLDRTTAANRGYVVSKHFATRYK